ncbi:hypothetical protein L1049_025405 [Liquidambar formosana]|uniref:tRNA pseudouridine synthase n=1 Tax=Liquidambar formosana TaxID=63359 RepID=A0AAP0R4K5_LIQFO
MPGYSMKSMNHHSKRYVALKSEIFKALEKTRLLVGDKKELQYSRCGRTDKGVSSVGQVIALFLRSNLKEAGAKDENSLDIVPEDKYGGEIDYVKVLNRVLPNDIRVLGWCPAPIGFNARFVFSKFPFTFLWGNQLWAMKIKGSAFLWHQVRCMVAVLFMIGQGLESPDVIDALLDTDRTPRKPQYIMAPEIPLVLQACEFEGLKFTYAGQALHAHLENECRNYQLQAAIFHEALLSCSSSANGAESNIPCSLYV